MRSLLISIVSVTAILILHGMAHAEEEAATDSLPPSSVSGGINWTYWVVDTIASTDNKRAGYSNAGQNYAYAQNFGVYITCGGTLTFDSIKVMVEGYGTGSSTASRQIQVGLLDADGVPVGDFVTVTLNKDSDTRQWIGGTTNKLWGYAWSYAELSDVDFGVRIRDANTTATQLYIDQVLVRVFYKCMARNTVYPTIITE